MDEPEVNTHNEQMDMAEGKDKGWTLNSVTITQAENGFSVRCEKKRKSKKKNELSDYKTETFVYGDKDKMLKEVGEMIEEYGE